MPLEDHGEFSTSWDGSRKGSSGTLLEQSGMGRLEDPHFLPIHLLTPVQGSIFFSQAKYLGLSGVLRLGEEWS